MLYPVGLCEGEVGRADRQGVRDGGRWEGYREG